MKHLAAYLLLTLAGKTPDAKSIKALLKTVGIEGDDARIKTLLSELDGKDLTELIAEGTSKLSSVPSGGDTKEEEKEESDDDMGFGLFD
ncbi:6562_t:CDS:2 [Entrophospora sp. SA101]|nr:6672_t:CDS:2 [Entrophospora sp. SA101]CAJ0892680.1 6562_t:CDS:2 [Entrophospora sp. SA101]CAJ0926964.1 7730_t:CDS:2 [Entrophospora sp. SA101]